MLHRCNVVDNIDPSLIDEQYIDDLPIGLTMDYLLGRAVGMFHQHIIVNNEEDDILMDITDEVTCKPSVALTNIFEMLSNHIHEMYVNYEDGSVFDVKDWIPSCVFLESLSLDYRVTYQVIADDNNTCTVIASLNKDDVRRNVMNNNVTATFFRAEGKTYSEAMCKCLLKYFFDLGVRIDGN